MDATLALSFLCPLDGQLFDHRVDFAEEPVRVIACMRCQTRFSIGVDGSVRPLNRDLPAFQATLRESH